MKHSAVVGGSTAKRVIACPGSVRLCAKAPPKLSSSYADEGTLLHNVIAAILESDKGAEAFIGTRYADQTLTQDLIDEKLRPALRALDEIDPNCELELEIEAEVSLDDLIPGAFGSCDLLGKLGDTTVILDWKFGSGEAVEVEENEQLMFYAAAAMRTKGLEWAFEGTKALELIIVQPPYVKRWKTTFERIAQFESALLLAVREAQGSNPRFHMGDHCRWCSAKSICPEINNTADELIAVINIDDARLGFWLERAAALEQCIADVRKLAHAVAEAGGKVPGYKLVAKRANRQWVDPDAIKQTLLEHLPESDVMEATLISPAQAEKKLKKLKLNLPENSTVAISSGSTLVRAEDPRPEVLQIGRQLTAALNKLN
jgi:hypothetical protein